MSRTRRTLCLLTILLAGSLPAKESPPESNSWSVAKEGWNYVFPRDHGPHRTFKTEWWYATGNLLDEQGHEYGFQLTFFRQGIHPGEKSPSGSRFRVNELPFAHFAFTDVSGHDFRSFQRSSRGAFGEAGFALPHDNLGRMAWMDGWVLEQLSGNSFRLAASDSSKNESRGVYLTLLQESSPLIHGQQGISPKSSKAGHASHYYSLTRLKASGSVTINGVSHQVKGTVWFDHEWSTNQLESDEEGWDWSGLHLSNGDDLMIFRIRDNAGGTSFRSGTLRSADGKSRTLDDIVMIPQGIWKSPHTGGLYPAAWDLKISSIGLSLTVTPKLADQELLLAPFAYWEGAVRGEGSMAAKPVKAEGYFEMTGYGGKILGLSQ
jgi:predicted secreted hydrolase